ncbi:hypothetical protein PIROE2DRAFT_14111 [Piromyces sp. E2]|nr:hypothetical protein PIROE2DRAFT_14111 [Piromyces sp. E2]|eukprot:OUM60188.1 hypothetical protein PIROE2DRAFT_14111 [Piromyces sp. E2]
MMKKIREERERTNSKTLEIKKLKKKEYEASQLAKKLEQSNQLQQILLKRRKDEMKACQRKMKSMMDYLNRSNIPKTIAKSPRRKRPKLPLKHSEKDKDEMLINGIDLDEDSRLKRKKQILDHELDQCIIAQETQHMIDEMEKKKIRLLDEQRELKNEREKIIRIESAKSKSFDPEQPQYMDDRLEMIDAELQLINSRIIEAKKSNFLTDGVNGDENGFSNAINIIKSTSFDNLQKLTEMLLSDIVEMKLKERHQMAQAASNERTIADLRVTLQVMKKTAVSAAIEYERKVKDLRHQQAYRQDQGNKTLSEYDDNYSDVTGGDMDDEDDGDISNILKKEKSIVENDNDDNWLGKGEIYNKIYETGVIKGGRAEAVVNAAASNQNVSEDVDLSNNEASLDYISTSYTPGLPSEIYQNISAYKNEDGKDDNGEGEYLNDDDMNLPITPVNKRIEDNTFFLKPGSTGGKSDDSVFLSPNTENTIINTIINSGTYVNTSTPYQFSGAKELDINTPLKNKGIQPLSPIQFSQENSDNSPLNNTLTLSLTKNLSNNNYSHPNENSNPKNDTNINIDINTTTTTTTGTTTKNIDNSTGNEVKENSSALQNNISNTKNEQTISPLKNTISPTTPNRVSSNSSTSSIPIASSKKTKKFEFKKPDEINKSKKLISPPKNKVKSPTTTLSSKSSKTPNKNEEVKKGKTKIEEKSPAKKSSFMSTLKNSTHFLTSFTNPFTSPKKSPIKKPTFLFLQSLKIGGGSSGNDKNNDLEEKESKVKNEKKNEDVESKVSSTTTKTPKRKNEDRQEQEENDPFISPPPSKRIKKDDITEVDKNKNKNKDKNKNESNGKTKTTDMTNNSKDDSNKNLVEEGSTPKSKLSSPGLKSPLSVNTLSDIVKSVHEESMQKLQNEMKNRSSIPNEKLQSTNSSFSQDSGDTSTGDISRLAYHHTQASQAKINTKSTTTVTAADTSTLSSSSSSS